MKRVNVCVAQWIEGWTHDLKVVGLSLAVPNVLCTWPQLPLSTQVLNGELLEYGSARLLTMVGCISQDSTSNCNQALWDCGGKRDIKAALILLLYYLFCQTFGFSQSYAPTTSSPAPMVNASMPPGAATTTTTVPIAATSLLVVSATRRTSLNAWSVAALTGHGYVMGRMTVWAGAMRRHSCALILEQQL